MSDTMKSFPTPAATREHIEQARTVVFWGAEHTITPVAAPLAYGDGQCLIAIAPINHRPRRFIVAVDSSWWSNSLNDDDWQDFVDEIEDDIIARWGEHSDDCLDGDDPCDCDFPRASWDSGKAWWHVELLTRNETT